ncbi:hypothetical protein HYH03_000662 [Edaphochlamys debaryana]|uniref:Uncharacterized protein n=1 Tax=Edaphochlamys debaryana TaxID=47281 RepID=A0A835YPG4_9CHLO|nr:hypothetical protein HYH03_000662 [Edaphochlamys debaryana]|eukprot:KAG2502175.1 hypothetical protein HYH03_000662 [Edaphochlamys debaryana]
MFGEHEGHFACDRPGAVPWIETYFHDCIYPGSTRDEVGFSLGLLSILIWLGAMLPQFISNIKNQSAEALSIWFLVEWFAGDTLNLLGCLIQGEQLPTTTLLAMYFVLVDVIMLLQYIYYGAVQARRKRLRAKHRRSRHHHHHHRANGGPGGGVTQAIGTGSSSRDNAGMGIGVYGTYSSESATPYTSTTNSPWVHPYPPAFGTGPGESSGASTPATTPMGRAPTTTIVARVTAAANGAAAGGGNAGAGRGWRSTVAAAAAGMGLVCVAVTALQHAAAPPLGLGLDGLAAQPHRRLLQAGAGELAAELSLSAGSLEGLEAGAGLGAGSGAGAGPVGEVKCSFLNCDVALVAGTVMGYLSTCFYLSSRVSQIRKNLERKCTDGLNKYMFIMTISANLCTGCSIVLRLRDAAQLRAQAPWLCGTFGTIALDVVLFYQAMTLASGSTGAAGGGGSHGHGHPGGGAHGHGHGNGSVQVAAAEVAAKLADLEQPLLGPAAEQESGAEGGADGAQAVRE